MQNIICFVCTANICRSAFAAAYARKRIAEGGPADYSVESTGTRASNGHPSNPEMIEVAKNFDVDMSSHRSQTMEMAQLDECRFILCMEQGHCAEIERQYPDTKGRVYLLRNFAGRGSRTRDIADPVGLPNDFLHASFDDIAEAVDGFLETLKNKD